MAQQLVIDEISDSAPTALQAVKLLAMYLLDGDQKVRATSVAVDTHGTPNWDLAHLCSRQRLSLKQFALSPRRWISAVSVAQSSVKNQHGQVIAVIFLRY